MPLLPTTEVHVWWVEKDHYQQATSRDFLSTVLSRYSGIDPSAFEWGKNAYGKPYLSRPESVRDLNFNISHSGNRMALAVAWNRPVGIDIERKDPSKFDLDLVEKYFSPSEQEELRRFSGEEQSEAFFRAWTRKEAYVKAVGLGLHLDLSSFSVSLDPLYPQLLKQEPGGAEKRSWKICNLDLGDDYAGALVSTQMDWQEICSKIEL